MQQLIYNQRKIPEGQWRYGFRSSAKIGCAWVATYNALCILEQPVEIPALIRRFERQIPVVNGALGTFLGSPAWMLHQMGFRVRMVNDRKKYDALAKQCPVCLLSYYWHRKYKAGAHFVALRWTGDHFEGYNTFSTSNGPDNYGTSLDAFLKTHHYFGTVLTLIQPPQD